MVDEAGDTKKDKKRAASEKVPESVAAKKTETGLKEQDEKGSKQAEKMPEKETWTFKTPDTVERDGATVKLVAGAGRGQLSANTKCYLGNPHTGNAIEDISETMLRARLRGRVWLHGETEGAE